MKIANNSLALALLIVLVGFSLFSLLVFVAMAIVVVCFVVVVVIPCKLQMLRNMANFPRNCIAIGNVRFHVLGYFIRFVKKFGSTYTLSKWPHCPPHFSPAIL